MSEKRLEATIYGRVQGVNFRYYTRRAANQLGVSGWVANQPDGSVRVVAEGAQEVLNKMVTFLHRGSPSARVDRVDFDWATPTGEFTHFSIRWL